MRRTKLTARDRERCVALFVRNEILPELALRARLRIRAVEGIREDRVRRSTTSTPVSPKATLWITEKT